MSPSAKGGALAERRLGENVVTGSGPEVGHPPAPELRFAVVREDSDVEAALVERLHARRVLVIASGGCTALNLATRFADLEVVAFDQSRAQIDHVRAKAELLASGGRHVQALLNVEVDGAAGLNQSGEFEKLFRTLRRFIEEFVASPEQIRRFFAGPASDAERAELRQLWIASRYWPAGFAVAFNDPLLHAMFGPQATQHAAPGSYPGYFQRVFERGLCAPRAHRNPFLQHILLGHYRAKDAPVYVTAQRPLSVTLIEGSLEDVPDLDRFDLYSLSNVFDWSDDELVSRWVDLLAERARPWAAVLVRQLNNDRDLSPFFESAFAVEAKLGADLLERDRSLFYNRIVVAFRRPR